MTIVIQSAIKETRDQLMLDEADGEYLNVISSNYGIKRPPFGFTEAMWRALTKLLALHYKQIKTKFEDILAVLFGPKATITTTLTTNAVIGDMVLYVVSTHNMPQVGTLVIDKGLPTEEYVKYSMIRRADNKLLLDSPLTFNHTANNVDYTSYLVHDAIVGDTSITVADCDYLTGVGFPYSLTLGVGSTNEETVAVSAIDTTRRTLTVSPLSYDHKRVEPSTVQSKLSYEYLKDTFILYLDSSKKFPEEGVITLSVPPMYSCITGTATTTTIAPGLLPPDSSIGLSIVFVGNVTPSLANVATTLSTNTGTVLSFPSIGTPPVAGDLFYLINTTTASSGTTTSVNVGSSLFTAGTLSGSDIVFVGNITATLAGTVSYVTNNTANSISFETIPFAPAAGDLFYLRPRVPYVRNSYVDNALIMRKKIPYSTFPKNFTVELLSSIYKVTTGQVQVEGIALDVIQSDDRHVEILLPEILKTQDLRTASYIHELVVPPVSTTLASPATTGDTTLSLTDATQFQTVGTLTLAGTVYSYKRPILSQVYISAGSTNLTINVSPGSLPVNVLSSVIINGTHYAVSANSASSISFSHPLKDQIYDSLVDNNTLISYVSYDSVELLSSTVQANAIAGSVVSSYSPNHSSGITSGNIWNTPDTWPGPYVFDARNTIPYNLDNITTLTTKLAGPIKVVLDQNNFHNALEVDNASFLPSTGFPFNIRLGATTGNLETTELTDVNFKQRTYTTLATSISPNSAFIEVNSLGSPGGSRFPNSNGYRVIVGEGTVNEEIIYVQRTDGAVIPPRIYCEPTINPHSTTETVRLMADVLSVTGLSDVHNGWISYTDRKSKWPTSINSKRIENAETVNLLYTSFNIAGQTGLTSTAGTLRLNLFGSRVTIKENLISNLASGSNLIVLSSTSNFPTTGYPYPIVIGKGTYNEETVFVTNNVANTLQLLVPTTKDHYLNEIISPFFTQEEEISYSSIIGNTVRFLNPVVLESNHYIGEPVAGTRSVVSTLKKNGYDFPLRMPTDPAYSLYYLIDLVRAAGVEVTVIYAR